MDPDMENQAVIDRITKIKMICDVRQDQGTYLRMWNSIFVISCAFAVSLDPLFFYVVNVNQDRKCLHTDETLEIVALVMRTLTDVIFLGHLICEILALKMNTSKNEQSEAVKQTGGNSGKKWEARELIQYARKIIQNMSSIIIDVLALIPLPQLIIIMFYPREGSGFVEHNMFVNVFLLGQYVPRVLRIHLSAKAFKRMNGRWANGLFNLFLYILAGHVLGAFWYFFSIQRVASCWHEAWHETCVNCIGKCEDTLYCDSDTTGPLNQNCSLVTVNTTAINMTTYLNGRCPLDTPDGASPPFNFGIFLDSLKNKNPDQEFGKKFLYSFWWGLRNLSNFGTNLVTSTYVWENLFAILISVIGLLLFIYLIGNVEAFMLMGATKTLDMRRQSKKKKEAEKTLKKIPMLKDKDEKVLKMMCNYLKPATYVENSFVFRTGDPLDCMLFVVKGTLWTYASSDSHARQGISSMAIKLLREGDFYGEELLYSALDCFTEVPVSSKHVKSQTKVEAFVLMAEDLATVVSLLGPLNCNNPEAMGATKTLKKIPMLKDKDEKVLKMMCDYLKPATYVENSFIFRTGDPLDCMLLIIEGTMWTYTSSDSHDGQGIPSMAIKPLGKGDFYGEELLDWASDFTKVPASSKHVKCHTKVEAFVLMAKDLVSPLRSHRDLLIRCNPEESKKMTLSAFLRSNTKVQLLPPPSLAEIGDDNSVEL